MKRHLLSNAHGFTLLEIAIVMVIIGILTGGGISLMKVLTERKARNATADYLQQVRTALVGFAVDNGRLPWADSNGDGTADIGTARGTLPFLTLQLPPSDAYKKTLNYEINANLAVSRSGTCSALRAGLSGRPQMVDADGSAVAFSVAAVLVSAGPMDADGSGNVFDDLTTGAFLGNNATGTPAYLRHPPVQDFDDLTAYVGGSELSANTCEYLDLAVNNNSGATVYLYNVTQGSDIATIPDGGTGAYTIISATRIELRSAANGGGAIVDSTPPTPITLAGRGATIDLDTSGGSGGSGNNGNNNGNNGNHGNGNNGNGNGNNP
jgi:prepilin-type N-terminal cleavage/methylation domain-containing protein